MRNYIRFRKDTGKITQTGMYPESQANLLMDDEHDVIFASASDHTHYVKNGSIVEYPERPSDDHEFDFILEQWVDTKTDDIRAQEALEALRRERNIKLAMSDWTQLPDSPLNEEQKAAWAEYRQALRDIPNTGVFEQNLIQWPQPPGD
jgi:hypothetical protein